MCSGVCVCVCVWCMWSVWCVGVKAWEGAALVPWGCRLTSHVLSCSVVPSFGGRPACLPVPSQVIAPLLSVPYPSSLRSGDLLDARCCSRDRGHGLLVHVFLDLPHPLHPTHPNSPVHVPSDSQSPGEDFSFFHFSGPSTQVQT
ncbi:hypothetical protein GQ44DRAFT_449649 [Phaeosphaeriaceae sp. PMI808]|nr:hypothetical protein GQ44DRAFT_449649 [Phaeosphaeriaceae sp. PMI808]